MAKKNTQKKNTSNKKRNAVVASSGSSAGYAARKITAKKTIKAAAKPIKYSPVKSKGRRLLKTAGNVLDVSSKVFRGVAIAGGVAFGLLIILSIIYAYGAATGRWAADPEAFFSRFTWLFV